MTRSAVTRSIASRSCRSARLALRRPPMRDARLDTAAEHEPRDEGATGHDRGHGDSADLAQVGQVERGELLDALDGEPAEPAHHRQEQQHLDALDQAPPDRRTRHAETGLVDRPVECVDDVVTRRVGGIADGDRATAARADRGLLGRITDRQLGIGRCTLPVSGTATRASADIDRSSRTQILERVLAEPAEPPGDRPAGAEDRLTPGGRRHRVDDVRNTGAGHECLVERLAVGRAEPGAWPEPPTWAMTFAAAEMSEASRDLADDLARMRVAISRLRSSMPSPLVAETPMTADVRKALGGEDALDVNQRPLALLERECGRSG